MEGRERSYTFFTLNLLTTDTFHGPLVSVLTGLDWTMSNKCYNDEFYKVKLK